MALVRKYFVPGTFVAVALGAIFAFLGVYGTNDMPYYNSFIFWTTTMLVGLGMTAIVAPWVFNKALKDAHLALQLFAVVGLISVPVTLVLAGFENGFSRMWPLYIWALQYMYTIIISLIVIVGGYTVLRAFGLIGQPAPQEIAAASSVHKFLERLPMRYRGADLYALSSEDHYLRAHTDLGEELILMRLSDALRELEGADGLQTHRSWWVARIGVAEVNRENGKQTLTLKSGTSAPISRSFVKAVKDANFGMG